MASSDVLKRQVCFPFFLIAARNRSRAALIPVAHIADINGIKMLRVFVNKRFIYLRVPLRIIAQQNKLLIGKSLHYPQYPQQLTVMVCFTGSKNLVPSLYLVQ